MRARKKVCNFEQTARYAVLNPAATTPQIQSYYTANVANGKNVAASVFSVATPSCGTQISPSLPYTTAAPVSIGVTLTARSCRPS